VGVYLADLGYGGPQEGGWWYDRGELARIVRTYANEERAYAYSRRLNRRLASRVFGPNQGKREKSSVLSDGCYEACVYQDHAPQHYPAQRPQYE
jgi:Zn-finger nucleic acid-binding protein